MIPTKKVLEEFQSIGELIPLSGGQGECFRTNNIVLKLADEVESNTWIAEIYSQLKGEGFRVPKPIKTITGSWLSDGWCAWEYLDAHHVKGHWKEIIETCIYFHKALEGIPKPKYFETREDPWAIADKVVWDNFKYTHHPKIEPYIEKLESILKPIEVKNQLIHGDFGGNVLFAQNELPTVIDFSPYWRPVGFAIGVIVADALVWENSDYSILNYVSDIPDFNQLFARAELRRVVELETNFFMRGREDILNEITTHIPTIDFIYNLF